MCDIYSKAHWKFFGKLAYKNKTDSHVYLKNRVCVVLKPDPRDVPDTHSKKLEDRNSEVLIYQQNNTNAPFRILPLDSIPEGKTPNYLCRFCPETW